MTFTLINARPSPYGRKVAIALIEKGLQYEVRYDVPWNEGTCTPEFSPLEQLPILITENGEHVYDSTFILEWLERCYPSPALLPADNAGALQQKKIQMLAERLMEIAQALIFELQRPNPSQAWTDRQTRKIRGGMAELDRQIGNRRPANQDPIYLGDIATGTTLLVIEFAIRVGYVAALDSFHWRETRPNLRGHVEAIENRPSFAATIPELMDLNISTKVQ